MYILNLPEGKRLALVRPPLLVYTWPERRRKGPDVGASMSTREVDKKVSQSADSFSTSVEISKEE